MMHITKLYRFDCVGCKIHFRVRAPTGSNEVPACPKHKDAKGVKPCKGHSIYIHEKCMYPGRRVAGAELVPT